MRAIAVAQQDDGISLFYTDASVRNDGEWVVYTVYKDFYKFTRMRAVEFLEMMQN